MNLKKNDKLILIVGVVILVVAAIGIAFYTSADTD
jgi:flagellar basal body-associated protein FliL